MQMMEDIQTACIERGEASVFVRRFECLHLVNSGDTIKFKKAWINAFDVDCAIVSYPWTRPENEPEVAGSCFIEDDAGGSRRSETRYSVWRRAADYMELNDVEYLWIDAECIAQEDVEARAKAIGEMDWLYHHASHPFGMLTRTVETEDELHLLAQILQRDRSFLSEDTGEFSLEKAWPAIHFLDQITSDIWWSRAWVYQENYHGGASMKLLMPHERELEDLKAKYAVLFGTLEGDLMTGELIIQSIEFSWALTDLCSAFIRSNPSGYGEAVARKVLSRAGRYAALLEPQCSMSPTIVADVGKRDVTNHPDRLPIIANCLSYNLRFDSNKLDKKRYSVSLATLVVFLLNGEIFCETSQDTVSPSDLTVVQFIQRYAFEKFSPPFQKNQLTFNKSCRFDVTHLASDGVHTSGHLWQLWKRPIAISRGQSKKWNTVKKTLWGLQKHIEKYKFNEGLLRQDQLAYKLRKLRRLMEPQTPAKKLLRLREPQTPAKKYMWKMAKMLADALQSGNTLRLGYLCDLSENPDWSPPMAVFICPDEARGRHGETFVFTSWARKTSDGPGYVSDVDKHVSLQVDVKRNGELPPRLSARAWMHGLWFWTEDPQDVVFPLPPILSEL